MIDIVLSGYHHHSDKPEVALALLENKGDNKNLLGKQGIVSQELNVKGFGEGVV
jgi:hypothetical protein